MVRLFSAYRESANFKIEGQMGKVFERGDSVKGGRSPRFRVQSSARRRPILAFRQNWVSGGRFFDSLKQADQYGPSVFLQNYKL